jgi:5,10-methylenetetrahydromethanopterin reductase
MVKFGIFATTQFEVERCVKMARLADKYGIEYVWVPDESPSPPFRDVFVTMASLVSATRNAIIGASILPVYTRHPAIAATAMLTLYEISKGRVILGLGPGGSEVLVPLGIKMWDRPVRALREAVTVSKKLFDGEQVTFEGEFVKTYGVKLFSKPSSKIPIYIGARSPKLLELAGEVADGVIMPVPLRYLGKALEYVKQGVKRANRSLSEIDIVVSSRLALDRGFEELSDLRRILAHVVADFPAAGLDALGISRNAQEEIRERIGKEGISKAAELVSEPILNAFAVRGSVEQCAQTYREFVRLGATQLGFGLDFLSPEILASGELEEGFRLMGRELIPAIRD